MKLLDLPDLYCEWCGEKLTGNFLFQLYANFIIYSHYYYLVKDNPTYWTNCPFKLEVIQYNPYCKDLKELQNANR